MRPFRFGVGASALAAELTRWPDHVRRLEDLGYDVVSVGDHPSMRLAGPLTALTMAAMGTTRLRVGTYVLANDLRHPALLAREIATLDELCGGRVELGIGAGWLETDYSTYGIPFDDARTRIERLEEALIVLERHFVGQPFSFTGKHYVVEACDGFPPPLQQPRPPIVVGGGGQRVLEVAARHADIVALSHNFRAGSRYLREPTIESSTWAATLDKVARIRDAAGPRFDRIELGALVQKVVITDDVDEAATAIARSVSSTPDDVLGSPTYLIGDASRIVDRLVEQREVTGISYLTVVSGDAVAFAPVLQTLRGR